jgi:hypothetical protein
MLFTSVASPRDYKPGNAVLFRLMAVAVAGAIESSLRRCRRGSEGVVAFFQDFDRRSGLLSR